MYTGKLIDGLIKTAERVRHATAWAQAIGDLRKPDDREEQLKRARSASQSEQFPQPFSLGTADRDLGLFLIVHSQLIRALEPGNDLPNPIDVYQI